MVVNNYLDRETKDKYYLKILVSDGKYVSTSRVLVSTT